MRRHGHKPVRKGKRIMNDVKDRVIIEMQKQIQLLKRELKQEKEDNDYLLKLLAKALGDEKIVAHDDEMREMPAPKFLLEENMTGDMIISVKFR